MTTTIDQLTGQPLENGQPPGFYQRFNVQIINGKAYPWQAGQPADVAGMNAALAAQGQQPIEPASNQEVAQVADPNGPGNGEGGSDIGNILAGLSFVVGGSALAGALGASGMTAGQSLGNLANGFMNPSYGAVNSFDSGAMQNILDGGAADALTAAGVPAAAAATVASNVARGVTMTDALRMAGVAAPVIGALLSSGAIRDATGSQQQATDQAIDQITGGSQDATRTLNAAQLAGADTQRAALNEGLTGLQTQYDRGVGQQNDYLNATLNDLTGRYDQGVTRQEDALTTARGDLAPYREAGAGAITRLSDLLGTSGNTGAANYGDLTKKFTLADFWDDPVTKASYQQGLDLGTKSLQNSAARSGSLNSGATAKALARFGVDYTGNQAAGSQARFVGDQNNTYNRLTGVANIGQEAVNSGNTLGFNTAANIANQGNSVANAAGGFRAGTANNIANAGNLMATNAAQLRAGTASNIANSGNVAGTNAANIEVGRTNSIANLLSGMGNARGAAAIAQGNTLAGAGNTVANWWNSQDTLDKILNARRTA